MYIRTTTRNSTSGETYLTHRLVESRRVGGKVREITILNLGRQFPLPKAPWPELCERIGQLLGGQQSLMPASAVCESVERCAQHCFSRLVAQGVVCDGSGFIRRSRVFAGNAVEWRTLEQMLAGLSAPAGAMVIMDRGIATEANLTWLKDNGYRYLVVSRARERRFDAPCTCAKPPDPSPIWCACMRHSGWPINPEASRN